LEKNEEFPIVTTDGTLGFEKLNKHSGKISTVKTTNKITKRVRSELHRVSV